MPHYFCSLKSLRSFALLIIVAASALFTNVQSAQAALGDITNVRITKDGWYAEVDIDGFKTGGTADYGMSEDTNPATIDNNPDAAKMVFTVTSQGYDTNGNLGTITRTVYGTKTLRKPYPNQNTLDESVAAGKLTLKVALSEYVYDDDKNGGAGTSGTDVTVSIAPNWYRDSGAGGSNTYSSAISNLTVTNNSTIHYPKVIGRWAWPSYEQITGGQFLVEATAFHKFAQYGKPIAAIAFAANDQSGNTVYATTTDMTISARGGDQNPVLVYAANLSTSNLTQGHVIDVNFRAYPWVGDESSILDSRVTADGFAQPDERLGPLAFLNDKNGTYGGAFAVVSRSGSDSTGKVYASQSAAESANKPYLTIGAAAAAIKAFNTTTYSRSNAGGGTILLTEGNHPYPGTTPSADLGTSMSTWLTIKPASTAAQANTKISSGSTNAIKGLRIKLEGLTLSPSVPSGGGISGRTAGDVLWLHNNIINATTTVPFFAWRLGYATDNTITSLPNGLIANNGGTRGPIALVRGNNSTPTIKSHFYAVLGNKNITGGFFTESLSNPAGHAMSSNALFAFNTVNNLGTSVIYANNSTSTGIAIVQNVYERVAGDVNGIMELSSGGGIGATTTNILSWHNTFAGERHQWAYNSVGTASYPKLNWGSKYNIFTEQGIKTDTFDAVSGNPVPNGNRVGNWSLRYGVGNVGNKSRVSSFQGEFKGLYSQWGASTPYLDVGFKADRSKNTGTNTGNGDYSLVTTSNAIDVATTSLSAYYQVLPYDLLGNPRYGSADAGAYEYQPEFTSGVDTLPLNTTARMYGNEKWKLNASSTNPHVAPLAITIPGNDKSQWLDIAIGTWNTSGAGTLKKWTETTAFTSLTNTEHTVQDLAPLTYYEVLVDSVPAAITGASCTGSVCFSTSGSITFTYTGSYGYLNHHTFEVRETTDTVVPTVNITAPADTATLVGTTTVSVSATDAVGIAHVDLFINGVFTGTQSSAPYEFVWDTTTYPNGSTILDAVAYDAAGNHATSTITVTVDNPVIPPPDTTAPTVSITAPSDLSTVSGTTVAFSVTASDNVAVVGVEYKLDGTTLVDTTDPYEFSWDSTTVGNGTYTLEAVARDAAGNYATSTPISITVEN